MVQELHTSLQNVITPQKIPNAEQYQRLVELRQKLNLYVQALHEIRPELDYSVFEAISRATRHSKLACIPTGVQPTALTPANQRKWHDVFQRLSKAWHIVVEGHSFSRFHSA